MTTTDGRHCRPFWCVKGVMSQTRKIVLLIVAAVMVAVMVLTWGSIGSMIMGLGLLIMGLSLAHQWFLYHQEELDDQMEE